MHLFGKETVERVTHPEPSDSLQKGKMKQLSPANFDLTLPSVQWSNWIWGYTAEKRRKLDKQEEDHIKEINKPIFGAFGGDRGPSGMSDSAKQIYKKRLTGAHESNTKSVWSW